MIAGFLIELLIGLFLWFFRIVFVKYGKVFFYIQLVLMHIALLLNKRLNPKLEYVLFIIGIDIILIFTRHLFPKSKGLKLYHRIASGLGLCILILGGAIFR